MNQEIGAAEARGDVGFFEQLLAPAFAMRRASGKVGDRAGFLAAVAPSPDRPTEIHSVTHFDANRALVECTVTMETAEGARRFHNVRLFTRAAEDAPWQLLAWANEPVA